MFINPDTKYITMMLIPCNPTVFYLTCLIIRNEGEANGISFVKGYNNMNMAIRMPATF